MVRRLNVGAGRLEVLSPEVLRVFSDGTWTHLGSRWAGSSNPRKLTREQISSLYGALDYREWHYERGDPIGVDDDYTFALAEHFVEHLWLDEVFSLFHHMRRVLVPGGVFRVVVPDADLRPNPEPVGEPPTITDWNSPAKHKSRWTYRTLTWMLQTVGFEDVETVRGYNESGVLMAFSPTPHAVDEITGTLDMVQRPDSLIIDAVR